MDKTYSFNIKKAYCFSMPQRRIKQILNYLDKLNIINVCLTKSFVITASKKVATTKLPFIVNLSNNYITYIPKLKNNVNLSKSFIMVKSKSSKLRANLSKSFILINKKKVFTPKTITILDKSLNFEEGICQRINEEKCTIFSMDKTTILNMGNELNNILPHKELNIEEFNNYTIKAKNNLKKNKIKKDKQEKLAQAGGFVLNRTIIISSSLAIILIAFILALKLIF